MVVWERGCYPCGHRPEAVTSGDQEPLQWSGDVTSPVTGDWSQLMAQYKVAATTRPAPRLFTIYIPTPEQHFLSRDS